MFEFLPKLFGQAQAIPEAWRGALTNEGILVSVEDVPTTITYRNYTRPGKYAAWNRKSGFVTAAVVTEYRFVIFKSGTKFLNLPFSEEHWDKVAVTLTGNSTLKVVADVTDFPNKHSGQVEVWLDTPLAPALLNALSNRLPKPQDA